MAYTRPFLDRNLSTRELALARRQVERYIPKLVSPPRPEDPVVVPRVRLEPVDGKVAGFIERDAAIGAGSAQVVLPAGRIRTKDGMVDLAVKFHYLSRHPRSATHFPLDSMENASENGTVGQSSLAEFLRQKGLHLPLHHFVHFPKLGIAGILTENLAAGGHTVVEADGFNFGALRNGERLKSQFEQGVAHVEQLNKENRIGFSHHGDLKGKTRLAILKAFFVRYDPKTRRGHLVLGDIDQFTLTGDISQHLEDVMTDEIDATSGHPSGYTRKLMKKIRKQRARDGQSF